MHSDAVATKTTTAQSGTPLGPLVAVIVANIALAFGPWFVRMADTGPVAAAFWRIALAVPVLLAAALLLGRGRAFAGAKGLWGVLAIAGVAFAADLGSWHFGIVRTTLANSTLFGNSATFIYPIYGFLIARAWPNRSQGIALLMAAAGAALLLGRSAELSPQNLVGDLFCILAGVLYAVYFIFMARARTAMAPLPALTLSSLMTLLPLLAFALLLGERIVPNDWTPLILLAVLSQLIGQGLMIYALGHLSPIVVGLALLLQPIVGATIGWIVYDERLALADGFGALLVAAALVLVRRGGRTPVQLAPVGAQTKSDVRRQ